MDYRQLQHSREIWRRMARDLDQARKALMRPGDHFDVVEDEAGDLLIVCYGIHGYPISIEIMRGAMREAWRPHAIKRVGDVRRMKRAPVASRPRRWWRLWR